MIQDKIMKKIILVIFLAVILPEELINAKSVKRHEVKDTSFPLRPYDVAAFNLNFNPRNRPIYQNYQQKSNPTTTTRRPLISYWQNIVRSVRLPVPSITWNVTNPLANFFNVENQNAEIDSYPTEDNYNSNSQRRHKTKRRRKNSHNKRNKKRKHPQEIVPETEEAEIVRPEENQIVLPEFSTNGVDTNDPMYFYDPGSDAYYSVQRVRGGFGSLMDGNIYEPTKYAVPFLANEEDINKVDNSLREFNEVSNKENTDDTSKDIVNNNDDVEDNEDVATDLTEEKKNKEEKSKSTVLNDATLRSALGTYMLDDHYNNQRQRAQDKTKKSNLPKQNPRDYLKYFFLLGMN